MDTLSRLTVRPHRESEREASPEDLNQLKGDLRYVGSLTGAQLKDFRELAEANHVVVRALTILRDAAVAFGESRVADWCEHSLADERARIARSIEMLHSICEVLDSRGCKIAVIKSLDHWPDLGSDLDLYTTADEHRVETVMREELGVLPVDRSWGDRMANKWNKACRAFPN